MGRVWAKIKADWYADPVLEACADEEPAALWLWPVLIGRAMMDSHAVDNPFGLVSTSAGQLARVLRVDAGSVERALSLLEEGDLVRVEPGKAGSLHVRLLGFEKWNAPRFSGRRRVAESRARSAMGEAQSDYVSGPVGKSAGKSEGESAFAGVSSGYETVQPNRETEKRREEKKESNILAQKQEGEAADSGNIRTVFDHWTTVCALPGGRSPVLNDKRRSKIRARLREGFTVEDLQNAITGFAAEPFYNGDQDGKRKLELQWRLADAAQVERGLELFDNQSKGNDRPDDQPRGRQL